MNQKHYLNIVLPVPEGEVRPRWSVMIPTFNPKEHYIIKAINSVIIQDPGSEIMQIKVVDDCSNKVNVEKIVNDNWNGRVKYYRLPENSGHSFNFTESVRRAKGELIQLLHDDDLVKPGFYSTMQSIFDRYDNIGAAFCRQDYIDGDGNIMFSSELEKEETGILDDALIKLAQKQRIQYCAMAVRRKVFENLGGFISKNIGCEDWEMWVRIAASYPVAYEPQALAEYRVHHGTSMTLKDMRSGQDMRFMREAINIFNEYVPKERRKEVNLFRRKYYGNYSLKNAKRLLEEFNDEEGAAAQLSETIKIDSELIYENINFLSSFKIPIDSAGVSVIICCNNNEDTIERTLRHLIIQRVPEYIPWEIILIDNASTDNTVKIAKETWKKFNGKTPFRIIEFEKSGILETRNNAIRNTKYNFVLFCNPGNLLNTNYVKYVSQNLMRDIYLGAVGTYTELHPKVKISDWFDDWNNSSYQIGEQFEYTGDITWTRGFVWGSGMAIRKNAWEELLSKNFKSKFENVFDENAATGIDTELCYALRLAGWRIWYSMDLKLKRLFTDSELTWKNFRNIWNQAGVNSVLLNSLSNSKRRDVEDFGKISSQNEHRKLIVKACRKLRSFKRWKLNSYSQTLTGDPDLIIIEYKIGRLRELLKEIKSYNKRIRLLRRISRKKDFRYLKYILGKPYFRFPQYRKLNDRRGVSLILNYTNTSSDRLLKSLQKISEQKINADFPWEVILIGNSFGNVLKNKIYHQWERSNCSASLKITEQTLITADSVRSIAVEKSKFDYLIFLNENNFIYPDYVRIAYKVIHGNKDTGLLGGQTELDSDVTPPKWFINYKEYFGIGKQAEEASDITFKKGYLWNAGMICRKQALNEIHKINNKFSFDIPEIKNNEFSVSDELSLSYNIKSAGWKIKYEPRLRLKKHISVYQFNWEYLRKLSNSYGALTVREEALSRFLSGNNNGNKQTDEKSWLQNANRTLSELRKYPLRKIFSNEFEFKGDGEVIEIERLQGRFKEIIKEKGKYDKLANEIKKNLNGNGFKDFQFPGNGSVKKGEKQKGVSIVICCYNSSKVIRQTLINICTQKVPENIPWEVIVVDNASTDNTSQIAQEVWDNHNCLIPFKIVEEPLPGLSAARQKGIESSKYEYIIFCDDDNRLMSDFVRLVFEIMNSNKEIGVLGGQSKAEFEITPANWFKEWKNSFAIGRQSENDGDITQTRGFVWGAAMAVRKDAWEKLISGGFKSLLTDRKGNTLSAGGDTEICYAIRNEGWKIWYDSRLKFKHFISAERLNWKYLRKLFRGFGQASTGLDSYTKNSRKKFPVSQNPPEYSRRKKTSARIELHKTLIILRKPWYKKLLLSGKEHEGNNNIPMIEYSIGRIESILKTRGTYNRGVKFLKRVVRKKDYKLLSPAFKDYNGKFPRYKKKEKLNGVSVIICTFNGEARLPETIKHIAKQKVDPRILWELILVDNASTDNTKNAVTEEWNKHNIGAKLIIVDEFTQGLSAARQKGFDTAKYEYLVLCDDDNLLDENFVQVTYEVMSSNKKIGVLGGPNEAVCELKPPVWFKWFQQGYAAGVQADLVTGKVTEGNITWKRGFVWGAGMILRKTALTELYSKGFKSIMSDRKGYQLSSGGDSEVCYALVLSGWEVWYDTRLKLKHCMPAGRITWNYLIRLFQGFGITSVGLDCYEKAIKLGRADTIENKINNKDWNFEFKYTLKEIRKYGIRNLLALRKSQDGNTHVPMMEYYIARLSELVRVRKEYDKNFESIKNAPWKINNSELKASHRKFIETENDFRYGWPWVDEPEITQSELKSFPKISILSPSFNSENTIEKAILSVLRQGYPNFEHIICDGGSKDGTLDIIKKYPHIKYVSEPDKGQCDAMNKAFKMSTGEIISYLNVDDYYQRGAFKKIAKAFEENPDSDMVVGNLYFEFEDHTYIRKPEIEYKKIMLPFKYIFPINPVSYFYKRKVQENTGPFPLDNHYTMDYWFLLQAYQKNKLIKVEDYLGTFCMNGFNKTSGADNRKNVHSCLVNHLKKNDSKNLYYYLYNYYKFYYYEDTPYNFKSIRYKIKKNTGRVYSVLTLKKNKYYGEKLFQKARSDFYLNKRIKSLSNLFTSFLIYPKGAASRSRQSLFIYSLLGKSKSEKAKLAYFFFTTPPGLPLANKLHYYGNEFKKSNKSIKGNTLLFLTYIISPKFIFKKNKLVNKTADANRKSIFYYLNPINYARRFVNYFRYKKYKENSYNYFIKAGEKYYFHKNFQAVMLMILSFIVYPASVTKRSRINLFSYSILGNKLSGKAKFAYHLYKDNPEYSFAHKLNYYGNELRKESRTIKGNSVLVLAYILSPKYIAKREKIKKSNVVFVSNYMETKKPFSLNPVNWVKSIVRQIRRYRNSHESFGTRTSNFFKMLKYRIKSVYYYFRYRKFKAQSKEYYSKAQESYFNNKRFNTVLLLISSFILYPPSIGNRNKLSLMINSILGNNIIQKLKSSFFK